MSTHSPWIDSLSVAELNDAGRSSLNEHLGIELTEITPTSLRGRMPVDARTVQPAGVLHGGASVAFAETLASWAAYLSIDRSRFHAVGQEINANHVRAAKAGSWVSGEATPAHIGRTTQVWDVRIVNDEGKLVCVSRCTIAVLEIPSSYAKPEHRN